MKPVGKAGHGARGVWLNGDDLATIIAKVITAKSEGRMVKVLVFHRVQDGAACMAFTADDLVNGDYVVLGTGERAGQGLTMEEVVELV